MTDRPRRVVLLIDYDNLQICASRDTPGRDLQLTPVVQLAQRYGTVILARAYAEWNLSTERLAVYKAGIEPAFAPVLRTESDRSGKSLADTVMVAEGMDMLWTLYPDVVVLATSDKDLIPLARVAKQRGAFVVVLGSDFTAIPLREMADEHVTYKQLITDGGNGSARQPAALPEPSRRRSREHSRERTPASSATPSTIPPRPEREPREPAPAPVAAAPAATPVATPVPAPTPTPEVSGVGEPVVPVAPISTGDDGASSTRRRRRRGSRRRTERLGLLPGEYGDDASADDEAVDGAAEELETPRSAPEPLLESPVEVTAEVSEETAESVEAPAPRERRPRRTRRTTTPAAEAPAPEASPVPELEVEVTPLAVETNGTAPAADAAAATEEPAPARTTRRRTTTGTRRRSTSTAPTE
jgi:hypothetical protein